MLPVNTHALSVRISHMPLYLSPSATLCGSALARGSMQGASCGGAQNEHPPPGSPPKPPSASALQRLLRGTASSDHGVSVATDAKHAFGGTAEEEPVGQVHDLLSKYSVGPHDHSLSSVCCVSRHGISTRRTSAQDILCPAVQSAPAQSIDGHGGLDARAGGCGCVEGSGRTGGREQQRARRQPAQQHSRRCAQLLDADHDSFRDLFD